ncbi:response regulator [Luteimonas saliphila]|uniref:response regulator n=1 Tax=Luteimonas saliphila TaxID=2804919 RepID=UPI00192E1D82|nr:response regulator [Luteimonas saliphila]
MTTGSGPDPGPATPGWRVLLVDDSRDDAELAEFAMRKGGLAVDCQRVHTGAALAGALRAFAPHAVVSDVNLPGFSGAEALALARAHDPGLPFVFLTGGLAPGEQPPGADGLLLKDDLDALPDVLRRLLGKTALQMPPV